MKAEDLMIGDVVMFPHGADKVRDIVFVDGKGMCASFAASATLFPVEVEKLEPLTITEDVLGQIGFTKVGQEEGAHILVGENAGVSYGLMYNIESKVLRLNGGLIPEPICNVHQLQHALHLCNIQYTIAL